MVRSPVYFLLFGAICGAVGFRFGWRGRHRTVLPLVQGALGFLAFAVAWRSGGVLMATLTVGGWAVGGTLAGLAAFRRDPASVDERVLRARPYREEMLEWLRSGRGPESRPLATARRHLWELALYLVAATASANFLALVMGAVLLNYMNAYVARLLDAARQPATAGLLAWNVWSVIRVAAYIVLGSACASPLAGIAGFPADPAAVRVLLIAGGAGVIIDLLLKLALSRPLGRRLAAAVDLERAAALPESG
jgi:hypothetical protein